MAEENPRSPKAEFDADGQDDILGKIDQLLNRHRPKASAADAVPVLVDASTRDIPIGDGIPVLTDVVAGPWQPASIPSAHTSAAAVSSALILRRLAVALETEKAMLLAQIGGDVAQARMLERLVTALKRALPKAVRDAIADKVSDSMRTGDDGRL